MSNPFDQFDAAQNSAPQNPFDQFYNTEPADRIAQADAYNAELNQRMGIAEQAPVATEDQAERGFFNNAARGAGERAADLGAGLLNTAAAAIESAPQGGFAPGYVGQFVSREQDAKNKKLAADSLAGGADSLRATDLDYDEKRNTLDGAKAKFGAGQYLGAAAELFAAGNESMLTSTPDMVGAVGALPVYVAARTGEIANERAKNKGLDRPTQTEINEAAPFAVASSLLERILPGRVLRGAGEVSEQAAKEISDGAIRYVMQKAASETGKSALIESGTEFVQEGIIEYIGQRYGTDAAMDANEAMAQGVEAAILGGIGGGTIGAGKGAYDGMSDVRRSGEQLNQDDGIDQPMNGEQVGGGIVDDIPQGAPAEVQQLGYNPERMVVMPDGTTAWESELPALAEQSAVAQHPGYARITETPDQVEASLAEPVAIDDEINSMMMDLDNYRAERVRQTVQPAMETPAITGVNPFDQFDEAQPAGMFDGVRDMQAASANAAREQDAKRRELMSANFQEDEEGGLFSGVRALAEQSRFEPVKNEIDPGDIADIYPPDPALVRPKTESEQRIDGALPAGFNDQRLSRPEYRTRLDRMAAELVKGGGVGYVRDSNDRITGRTPSLNADWFKSLNENPDTSMPVADAQAAIQKALKGDRLGVRQMRVVGAALDAAGEERGTYARELRALRENARADRRSAYEQWLSATNVPVDAEFESAVWPESPGENYSESDYLPDSGMEDRAIAELVETAESFGVDWGDIDTAMEAGDIGNQTQALTQLIWNARNEHRQPATAAEQPAAASAQSGPVASESTGGALEEESANLAQPQAEAITAIDAAASEAALSPLNDLPEPTEAQKEAGNYKKAHVKVKGLDIAIENPRGSTRSGTDSKGNKWEVKMHSHYGYIKRTEGADGDHVDVFIGPNPESDKVFIVDQINPDGSFDEHKVLIGFDSKLRARSGYKSNYSNGWKVGPITSMSMDEFKDWVKNGDTKKPLALESNSLTSEQKPANSETIPPIRESNKANSEIKAPVGEQGQGRPDESEVLNRRIESAKQEILSDIEEGKIPDSVSSFADLQDYVDANEYINDAAREDRLIGPLGKSKGWTTADYTQLSNKIISGIDSWLTSRSNTNQPQPSTGVSVSEQDKSPAPTPKPVGSKSGSSPKKAELDDAGEALVWNKKGKFKAGGLKWGDIKDENETLKVKLASKSKVWAKPNWEQIVDGVPEAEQEGFKLAAHLIKKVYDSIPNQSPKSDDESLQAYISAVDDTRKAAESLLGDMEAMRGIVTAIGAQASRRSLSTIDIASLGDTRGLKAILDAVFPVNPETKSRWQRGTPEHKRALALGNKALDAMTFDIGSAVKALKAIKEGWPSSQEAWQKQKYAVVEQTEVKGYADTVNDTVYGYVDIVGPRGKTYERLGTFESISAAETAANARAEQLQGKFALFNKNRTLLSTHDTEAEAIEAARAQTSRKKSEGADTGDEQADESWWERAGTERRENNRDVTPEELKDAFNFRGVNFGKWVNQKERQQHINAAYDALHDLAAVMNIPPDAIGLGGKLGIAFGAQGGGSAAAHFVPGVNEINITKTAGAGAVAHEWGHALDHHFGVMAGRGRSNNPFASHLVDYEAQQMTGADGQIRSEVAIAFTNIDKVMNKKQESMLEAIAANARGLEQARKNLDDSIKRRNIREKIAGNQAAIDALAEIEKGNVGDYVELPIPKGKRKSPGAAPEKIKAVLEAAGMTSAEIHREYIYFQGVSHYVNKKESDIQLRKVHTDFYKRSSSRESGSKPYWTTPHEMFARAFESWVLDRLADTGGKNNYLVRGSKAESFAEGNDKFAYPAGEERKIIGEAFDKLIAEIKVQDDESGNKILYSLKESLPQTETAAFSRWFGDSKVVDAQGNPRVMYHGTAASFDEFSKKKATDKEGRKLGFGWGKDKFYFAETGEAASSAAEFAQMTGRGSQMNVMPVYLSIKKPIAADDYRGQVRAEQDAGLTRDAAIAKVDKRIKSQGYDGIIDDETGGVAVFDPTQIKSASGNNGEFDPANPDIRYKKDSNKSEPASITRSDAQAIIDRISKDWKVPVKIKLIDSIADLPNSIKSRMSKDDGGAEPAALIDESTGHVYINLSKVESERSIEELVFHEVYTHFGLRQLMGDEVGSIMGRLYLSLGAAEVDRLAKKYGVNIEAYEKAYEGKPAEMRRAIIAEELLAHMSEHTKPSVVKFAQELVGAIRAWLRKNGFAELAEISESDMRHLLKQARETVTKGKNGDYTGLIYSLAGVSKADRKAINKARNAEPLPEATQEIADNDELITAWAYISQREESFQLPTSRKKDLAEIAQDIEGMNGFVISEADELALQSDHGAENAWRIRTPGGDKAAVYQKGDKVWIDVSDLESGDAGKRIYNIVANYAINTDRVFQGDPAGLSIMAKSRRLENMLSSAMKFGTTRHLQPHKLQLKDDAGVPALKWKKGDDVNNIREMIITSYEAVKNQFPEIENLRYDPERDSFVDASGEEITDARFNDIAANARREFDSLRDENGRAGGRDSQDGDRSPESAERGKLDASGIRESAASSSRVRDSGRERASPSAGRTTLKRAVLTHSILRGTSSEKSRILEQLSGQRSERLREILYALPKTRPSGGFSVSGKDVTETAAFKRWFGDSKVVDENGKPLVVHHGTSGLNQILESGFKKGWVHLTDSKVVADSYQEWDRDGSKGTLDLYVRAENPAYYDAKGQKYTEIGNKVFRATYDAERAGHDAMIITNIRDNYDSSVPTKPHTTFVVFSPSQIKSATGNSGQFSPDNPNILFALPKLKPAFGGFSFGGSKTPRGATLPHQLKDAYSQLGGANKTLFEKVKTEVRRQLAPRGLLPREIFDLKIARDGAMNADDSQQRFILTDFYNQVEAVYKKPYPDLKAGTRKEINDYLKGDRTNVQLTASMIDVLAKMRTQIQSLSRSYMDELLLDAANFEADGKLEAAAAKRALIETITDNFDNYLHRSYRAFDDPDWPKKVPEDVYQNAVNLLAREYSGSATPDAAAIEKATKKVDLILHEGTAYDSMGRFISESKLGSKDLSVIKKRKQISPEIRALLGEYEDPAINYAKSVTKMTRLVHNTSFLRQMTDISLQLGYIFEEENRPVGANKKIAAEASEVYAPLNGMYTYPEFEQALRDAVGSSKEPDWYKVMVAANGAVKYGKTVLAPTTAVRNFLSASMFALTSGHWNASHLEKSAKVVKTYFTGKDVRGSREYVNKLLKLGVLYDAPNYRELQDLIKSVNESEHWLATGTRKSGLGKVLNYAQEFYALGDDFWKILGYENEKALLIKHYNMSEAAAEREAAERIRNTYPTYSLTGKGIQTLRRFPVIGSFPSFPAEIIRTTFHKFRYFHKDAKALGYENPSVVAKGVGLALGAGMMAGLSALSAAIFGVDDDEEEAIRQMLPEWSKNSSLFFLGRDDKGQVQYMDLGWLDPYGYWKKPISALARDADATDNLSDAAWEAMSPFLGLDIAVGTTGQFIYDSFFNDSITTEKATEKLVKGLAPGAVNNALGFWEAAHETVTKSGKKYTFEDEALALLGFRKGTLNAKVGLTYQAYGYADRKRQAATVLREKATDLGKVDIDELRAAYEKSIGMQRDAWDDMRRTVKMAMKTGMSQREAVAALRTSGMSLQDASGIVADREFVYKPSKSMMKLAIKRTGILFDKEAQDELRERQKRLRELQREYEEKQLR